jgi:hypothetical protein
MIGKRLAHYQVKEQMGAGGMGVQDAPASPRWKKKTAPRAISLSPVRPRRRPELPSLQCTLTQAKKVILNRRKEIL